MEKKKVVLMLSKAFPKRMSNAGEPTNFAEKLSSGEKKHTIRANLAWWKKKAELINSGKAYLSIRQWEGMPYRSKQIEIARFDKISIQPLIIGDAESWKEDVCQVWDNESQRFKMSKLSEAAKNDGLPFDVFKEWFLPYDNSQTMAIVHFTEFKY